MPQILVYLEGHNGTGWGHERMECEVVPRIGERLVLKGFAPVEEREPECHRAQFVVQDLTHEWVDGRLMPILHLRYAEGFSYHDEIYNHAEQNYGRWPPVA